MPGQACFGFWSVSEVEKGKEERTRSAFWVGEEPAGAAVKVWMQLSREGLLGNRSRCRGRGTPVFLPVFRWVAFPGGLLSRWLTDLFGLTLKGQAVVCF